MSRRSARLALQDPALHILAPLFPELASLVFALLPVDSRLRCREVSRGWRAFLADARHWQILDLSLTSGVARRSLALLRAASERAHGTLRALDVSGWYNEPVGEGEEELEDAPLLLMLQANAASLFELHAWKPVDINGGTLTSTTGVEDLLSAAPRLRLLECDAGISGEEARGPLPRLLREPQFAPLRLRMLYINAEDEDVQPPPDVPALAAWAATHPTLKRLNLRVIRLDSALALDAVADLAVSQLQHVDLFSCSLSPASLPALTRMLESRSLTVLIIWNDDAPLLVGAAVPAFCAALRMSRLTTLLLQSMRMWESFADGLALIAACTSHPTLHNVCLSGNGLQDPAPAPVGVALAALVAADSALEELYVSDCGLDDSATRLLFAAIASSTELRVLICFGNEVGAACARDVILPAVQANTSLRQLDFGVTDIPELVQAMELVAARVG